MAIIWRLTALVSIIRKGNGLVLLYFPGMEWIPPFVFSFSFPYHSTLRRATHVRKGSGEDVRADAGRLEMLWQLYVVWLAVAVSQSQSCNKIRGRADSRAFRMLLKVVTVIGISHDSPKIGMVFCHTVFFEIQLTFFPMKNSIFNPILP